jgi:hypothetical protein
MTKRRISALLILSCAVLLGVSAPNAAALPTCQDTGSTSTCRTNGSVAIKARPGTVAPPANQPSIRWRGGPGLSINFGG